MVSRITIENFMSHTRTVIEPARCLTVLTGPNNSGKSAVVSALQVLCTNEKGTFMLRHGEKEVRVLLETHDGQAVEWRRKKNGSVTYVVNGVETHRNPPDTLHEVLRLPKVSMKDGPEEFDVHFGEQKAPIFLIDQSGRHAATFFASSSDAEYIMRMQALHRSRTMSGKQDERRLTDEAADLDSRLEALAPGVELSKEVKRLEEAYAEIGRLDESVLSLRAVLGDIEAATENQKAASAASEPFSRVAASPELNDIAGIRKTISEIETSSRSVDGARAVLSATSGAEIPPEPNNTGALRSAVEDMVVALREVARASTTMEALARLDAPPDVLHDAVFAEQIVELERHDRRERYMRTGLEALAVLGPAPQLSDVGGLAVAIAGLGATVKPYIELREEWDALIRLNDPPEERETDKLSERIEEVALSFLGLESAHERCDILAILVEPAGVAEIEPCSRAIAAISEAQLNLNDQQARMKSASDAAVSLRGLAGALLAANPLCPVCGQAVSARSLIDSLEGSIA